MARGRVLQAVRKQPSRHYLAQRASELRARALVRFRDSPSRLPALGSASSRLGALPLELGWAAWSRGGRALGGGRGRGSGGRRRGG